MKYVERDAMPNNLSCSAIVRPQASAMRAKARRPAPPAEEKSEVAFPVGRTVVAMVRLMMFSESP